MRVVIQCHWVADLLSRMILEMNSSTADKYKNDVEEAIALLSHPVDPSLRCDVLGSARRHDANEMSRAHTVNYLGLLHALLLKGVISPEELEAGRERAKPVVDQHFGPTPEEKKAASLRELFETIKARA